MPGLLSSIFDGASGGPDASTSSYDGSEGADASDEAMVGPSDGSNDLDDGSNTSQPQAGEYQSESSSYSANADNDTHVDPSVDIGVSMGGTYETPDGSTHSWQNSQDVSLDTDTHVVTEVGGVLTMTDETFG